MATETTLFIDGVPLDDLLPPAPVKQKRKEPSSELNAETQLKVGLERPLPSSNKGLLPNISITSMLPPYHTIS